NYLVAIMAGALVQSTSFPSAVSSESKVRSKRSGNTKRAVKMMCGLQAPPMRVRTFSGLRGANALDNLVQRGQDFHSKVAAATSVRKAKPSRIIPFTPRAKRVLELSLEEARQLGHNYIGSEHLLLGLLREGEGVAARVIRMVGESAEAVGAGVGGGTSGNKMPTLEEYGTNLTKLAEEGKLDPVVGRQPQIERVTQILGRRTKNNPCLIGEPGVGKTAIAEGLAQRIANGDVPETIEGKKVITLDMGLLVAGTKYRGEFEERLKKLMEEIKQSDEIILFIDECIGATTLDEYRKHIEKDPALERRFQPVKVPEPTVDETIQILKGLRERYEIHHKLRYTDDALVAAAQLSYQYISDRFLPDKAIDLIDEAGSRVRLRHAQLPEEARELEKELRQITKEKNEAVRGQDFEKAGELRALVQSTSFPSAVSSESKVRSKRSGNAKRAVKMMCGLQAPPMRVRTFSGLRGANALDNLVQRGQDFHSKVAVATSVRKAKPSRIVPKAIGFVAVEIPFTPRAKRVLELSLEEARQLGHNYIGSEHLLLGLLREGEGVAARVLENLGADPNNIRTQARYLHYTFISTKFNFIHQDSCFMFFQSSTHEMVGESAEAVGAGVGGGTSGNKMPTLEEYGTNLTKLAEEGKLDPVVGRQPQIERVITLDMGLLVAGTKYRGEFEERLKKLMEEIKQSDEIILFIDEVHTLIGAGAAEGAIDAANILKPALARGELQASETVILKDARHTHSWMSSSVRHGLRERYEIHHKLRYTDDALVAAAQLSYQYISDRFLPDKAIDLIDEAGSRVRLRHAQNKEMSKAETEAGEEGPTVTEADIQHIVSSWTGIPVEKVSTDESDRLLKMEETLHTRIIGQDEAVKAISRAIRRARVGLKNPNRPIASFIFSGPTGV
ncbi:hypothetical protein M8C21_021189, partial [Ambrosia artemisiifolia]